MQLDHEQRKRPCVYILASAPNGTLYIGVTSNLRQRMTQHAQKRVPGFSAKYEVTQLVYYEFHQTMPQAITRKKQLKKWNRIWKLRLIEQMNPGWIGLFDAVTGEIAGGPFDEFERGLNAEDIQYNVIARLDPRLRGMTGEE